MERPHYISEIVLPLQMPTCDGSCAAEGQEMPVPVVKLDLKRFKRQQGLDAKTPEVEATKILKGLKSQIPLQNLFREEGSSWRGLRLSVYLDDGME